MTQQKIPLRRHLYFLASLRNEWCHCLRLTESRDPHVRLRWWVWNVCDWTCVAIHPSDDLNEAERNNSGGAGGGSDTPICKHSAISRTLSFLRLFIHLNFRVAHTAWTKWSKTASTLAPIWVIPLSLKGKFQLIWEHWSHFAV